MLQEGTFKYRILSLHESNCTAGRSNNLLAIFQPQLQRQSLQFCRTWQLEQGSGWIENFADLLKNEEKYSYIYWPV